MLKKVIIERFKSINELTLELGKINVLIGGNNAGKSSVLQAIQFSVSLAQTTTGQYARWKDDRLPTSIGPSELIYSPLRDVYALAQFGQLKEPVESAIKIDLIRENDSCEIIVRKGRNKNISVSLEGKVFGEILQNIDNPYSIIVPGLAGIPAFESYVTPSIVRKAAARGDSNSVFRNILKLLYENQGSRDQFQNDLKEIFSDVDISVYFDPNIDEHINVIIKDHLNPTFMPIDSAGTGVLQAVQILSYINLYKQKLLILDEPDSHLHPNNQKIIADLLKFISEERGIQILLSTHSRYLIESLMNNSSIFWIRNGKHISDVEDSELKALMEIGALNEGENLSNQNIRAIVLTEDKRSDLISPILEASNFHTDEIEIWPYEGCSNINVALALCNYIKKHSPNCKIVIHRDRDFMEEGELNEYKEKLENDDIYVFITEGNDLESYYYNESHIMKLYNKLDIQDVRNAINDVLNDRSEKIREKFINTIIDRKLKSGERPNSGEIANYCIQKMNEDQIKYAHGKIVLKGINAKLQEITGQSPSLIRMTEHLKNEYLEGIANDIWDNA